MFLNRRELGFVHSQRIDGVLYENLGGFFLERHGSLSSLFVARSAALAG